MKNYLIVFNAIKDGRQQPSADWLRSYGCALIMLCCLIATGCLDQLSEQVEHIDPPALEETTIDAGGPYVLAPGESITLSPTLQLANNATAHDLQWFIVDGPERLSLDQSNPFQPILTAETAGPVILEVRLRYDITGGPIFLRTALDTAEVTILAANN